VDILINGQPIDLHMYLGEAGEAYFLDEKELDDEMAGENSQSNQSSASYDSNSKLNEIPPITVTDVDEVVKSGVVDSSSLQPAKSAQDVEKRESLNANVDHKAAFFYSDGEITPEQTSPAVSRPPSPKSDTEAEIKVLLIT
jgi:phosphatidate phosphatase PAH1